MVVTVKYYKDSQQKRVSTKRDMNIYHLVNSLWKHIDDYDKVEISFDDVVTIKRNMTYKSKRAIQSDIMAICRKYTV